MPEGAEGYQPTEADKYSAQLGPMEVETEKISWMADPQERNRRSGMERDRIAERLAEGGAEIAAVSEITDEREAINFLKKFDRLKQQKLNEIGKKHGVKIKYDNHRGSGDMDHYDIDGEWITRDELYSVENYLNPERMQRLDPDLRDQIVQKLEQEYQRFPKELLAEILQYHHWQYSDTGRTLDAAVSSGIIPEDRANRIREADEDGKIILSNGHSFRYNEINYTERGYFGSAYYPGYNLGRYKPVEDAYEGEQLWYVIAEPKKQEESTGTESE